MPACKDADKLLHIQIFTFRQTVFSMKIIILAVKLIIMAIFRISDNHIRHAAIASSLIFACLAALYFTPAAIPGKTALPLSALTIASLWLCPWQISAALLFSAIGDLAGSFGNFILQMGSFAVTHAFLIWFFINRYKEKVVRERKPTEKTVGYIFLINLMCAATAVAAFVMIIRNAPAGIIRTGAGIYTLTISFMLCLAFYQRSSLYALGALLFVFSDFILAWNRFTEPIEGARLLIMIPYYLGQWLIYIRSTSFRGGPEMRLMRF